MEAYKGTDINVYEVRVNDIFSDMDVHNPGFGMAIFECTMTESLLPLQAWINGVRTEEGMRDFAGWLQALFSEYDESADTHCALSFPTFPHKATLLSETGTGSAASL
jgi:hypothetical protein